MQPVIHNLTCSHFALHTRIAYRDVRIACSLPMIIGELFIVSASEFLPRAYLALFLQQPFFSNFGAICTFAILGTIISTAITGILV